MLEIELWLRSEADANEVCMRSPAGEMILRLREAANMIRDLTAIPIPMLLWCPVCHERHIDEGRFQTKLHHTHACQNCGHVWRPTLGNTVGVRFLPGFKTDDEG